ncbi:MAG: sugar kinase [Clostridia bacterium]|nr:sugar kinase [Deltaproteobacteria bacterium]
MSLLVVGTVAFDAIETPFGKREKTVGGSASFLGTSASYFTRPALVSVIGEDFPEEALQGFRKRGIDTEGIERQNGGKTFFWRGRYDQNLSVAHTLETQLNVLATFDPKLPSSYRKLPYVVLGNFEPTLQRKVVEQLDSPKLVAADTMNYWIESTNAELRKTLQHVHLLSVNEGEARMLSGEWNLRKAAKAINAMGPKIVVVKRGEYGATLFYEDEIFMAPAYMLETARDPTGAGDSFAGGLLGHLARHGTIDSRSLRQAIVMGSALGSFAVEGFGLERYATLTTADIRARFEELHGLTAFEIGGVKW